MDFSFRKRIKDTMEPHRRTGEEDPVDYSYQAKCFSAARRALMLPHEKGEAQSIASAFLECMKCLHELDRSGLEESARDAVRVVDRLIDTAGIDDPDKVGTFVLRAERLTRQERHELSRVVDELAHWFTQRKTLDQRAHEREMRGTELASARIVQCATHL